MDIVNLIISLISGGVGGNIAGAALKDKSFGVLGNTVAGLIGGGLGDFILQAMGVLERSAAGGQLSLESILANVGTSGVSGAALLAIVSLIKNSMNKTTT